MICLIFERNLLSNGSLYGYDNLYCLGMARLVNIYKLICWILQYVLILGCDRDFIYLLPTRLYCKDIVPFKL